MHCDDHEVVVVRVDINVVSTRENGYGPWPSLNGFGENMGYYVCNKHLSVVFYQDEAGISPTGKLPEMVLAVMLGYFLYIFERKR